MNFAAFANYSFSGYAELSRNASREALRSLRATIWMLAACGMPPDSVHQNSYNGTF